MRRPSTALLAVLLLALAAAGCGAQATSDAPEFSGAEADVAQVVEDLQEAAADKAGRRICTQILSRELAAKRGDDCPKAMEQAFDDTDTSELVVRDVDVSGTTATARITAGTQDDDAETLELVREGDAWRISRFAGPAQGS